MNARAPDELGELIASIRGCGRSRDIHHAKDLHAQAILKGLISNKYVANCLITLYAKCRSTASAARVFDSLIIRDLVSWNALLQGYVECGEIQAGFELFQLMTLRDGRSYVTALNACTSLLTTAAAGGEEENEKKNMKILEKGRAIHSEAVSNRCCDSFVKSSLVNFYSRANRMMEARQVFDELDENQRDTVAWNTLLQGYVANGESELALKLLDENSISRDARTFLIALNACANLSAAKQSKEHRMKLLTRGKTLHSQALESGCCDIFVESMAIDMFGKCGSMDDARRVFEGMKIRNSVSWTALLNGYISNDSSDLALELFEDILRAGECPADGRVFVAALTACASLGSKAPQSSKSTWLRKGREIYTRCSFRDLFVETALINMYAQCGSMAEARRVFEKMAKRSPVSWNSLIQGYVDNDENRSALKTFCEMDLSGTPPTSATFVAALTACKNSMLVTQGRELHSEIEARGGVDSSDSPLANSLIEFYSKAGNIGDAERVFSSIPVKETSSWNSLIGAYSRRGDHSRALETFQRMRERGVSPDKITFSHLLSACSHAGLTGEARSLFAAMRSEFRIEPDAIHYTCLVDLLCRANCSEEAVKMLSGMPDQPDSFSWSKVLSTSGGEKLETGELAFESLVKLDRGDASAYVSLARVYQPENLPVG